jgi:hypothetical protein
MVESVAVLRSCTGRAGRRNTKSDRQPRAAALAFQSVGVAGFEPTASSSRTAGKSVDEGCYACRWPLKVVLGLCWSASLLYSQLYGWGCAQVETSYLDVRLPVAVLRSALSAMGHWENAADVPEDQDDH